MRVVVILLLLINVAFAAWMQWGAPAHSRWVATPTTDAGIQPLTLWSERGGKPPPATVPPSARVPPAEPPLPAVPGSQVVAPPPAASEPPGPSVGAAPEPEALVDDAPEQPIERAAEPPPEPQPRAEPQAEPSKDVALSPANRAIDASPGDAPRQCRAVGPYTSRAAAQAALGTLDEQDGEVSLVEASTVERRFWVYLPPLDSRARAFEVERLLRDRGIRDLQVLAGGDTNNGISLGLYRQPEAAERRLRQIEALGYAPVREVIEQKQTYYWIQARAPESGQSRDWWRALLAAEVRTSLRPCVAPEPP